MNEDNKKESYGIISVIFAVLSFFALAFIFIPLAIIFAVIAILKHDTKLGVAGIVLAVVLPVIKYLLFLWVASF